MTHSWGVSHRGRACPCPCCPALPSWPAANPRATVIPPRAAWWSVRRVYPCTPIYNPAQHRLSQSVVSTQGLPMHSCAWVGRGGQYGGSTTGGSGFPKVRIRIPKVDLKILGGESPIRSGGQYGQYEGNPAVTRWAPRREGNPHGANPKAYCLIHRSITPNPAHRHAPLPTHTIYTPKPSV